jgi:flagellar biosynthesis/type III secretory pathway protein FliH
MGTTSFIHANPGPLKTETAATRLAMFFTEDFDPPKVVAPPPEPEPVEPPELVPYFTEQELETARRDGYEAGVADLRAATLEAHEAALAQSLNAIAAGMTEASAAAARVAEAAAEGIARLLVRMLATMMPALCARYGPAEIDAVMRRVLPQLKSEPRIVVEVNPDNAEALRTSLAGLTSDLAERVSLIPASSVESGDVRLTWQDGEAVRDGAALWRQIAEVLEPLGLLSPDAAAEADTPMPPSQ